VNRRPLALTIAAAIAVTGCGAHSQSATGAAGLGRAIAQAPAATPPPTPNATRDPGRPAPARGCPPRDLDAPARGCAVLRPLLRAASSFAAAYVRYQTGQLSGPVRAALRHTCVPQFARELVSQPVTTPRGTPIASERLQRVTFAGANRVDVTWTTRGQATTAQLQLERRDGRWLVAGLRPLI
jgi:hypothetical protein